MIAYIDESGDTGNSRKSTVNFILTAICVNDDNILPHIAKKVFSKKVINKNKSNQLHASKDNEKIKNAIINYINKIDYSIYYCNNKDYINNIEKLFYILSKNNVNKIYFAIKDSRKATINKINNIAFANNIQIIQTTTTKNKGLQIADMASWSIFRFVEYKDNTFYNKLSNIMEVNK